MGPINLAFRLIGVAPAKYLYYLASVLWLRRAAGETLRVTMQVTQISLARASGVRLLVQSH